MSEMKLVNGEFVLGYANGEQVGITNSTEQICAFIMKHRWENVIITDIFDLPLIETSMGFIQYCGNQKYLGTTLIPKLAPMQMGETEIPEFVPYQFENEEV